MSDRRLMTASSSHVNGDGKITDSWTQFIKNIKSGRGSQYYEVGNYIPLDLGEHGLINMEILAFNPPLAKADYSGAPNVLLFGKELLVDTFTVQDNTHTAMISPFKDNLLYDMNTLISPIIPDEINNNIVDVFMVRRGFQNSSDFIGVKAKFISLNALFFHDSSYTLVTNNHEVGFYERGPYFHFLGEWKPDKWIRCRAGSTTPVPYFLTSVGNKDYGTMMYTQVTKKGNQIQYNHANYTKVTVLPLGFCL